MPKVVEAELAHRQAARGDHRARPRRCDEAHLAVFDKIVAQLDDRGLRMIKQPKVPLDASQAIQRLLSSAREAVLGHAVTGALDRAKAELARQRRRAGRRADHAAGSRRARS